MHIMHLAGSLSLGGAEKLVFDLARIQLGAGHQVSIALFKDPHDESGGGGAAAERSQHLERQGASVHVIAGGTRDLLGAVRSLQHLRPSGAVDVVHAHLAVGAVASQLGMRNRPATVWTLHNTDFGFPRALVALTRPIVDQYVGCGPAVSESYRGLLGNRVATITNGVDVETFARASSGRAVRPDRLRLLSVGGLRKQKNYPRLVEAASLARERLLGLGVELELIIVGAGGEQTNVESSITRFEASSFTQMLGPRTDIPELMAGADGFVMASDYEGLPLSLLEALASGLPCVVTPFPGARDIIVDGTTGLIAHDFRVDDLAESIVRLGASRQLRSDLSLASRREALNFDIRTCAQRYEALYDQLLIGRQTRRQ